MHVERKSEIKLIYMLHEEKKREAEIQDSETQKSIPNYKEEDFGREIK